MKSKTTQKTKYQDESCRNDRVAGLKATIISDGEKKKVTLTYKGRYGLGYDGCGSHSHK